MARSPDLSFEQSVWGAYPLVAGMDEAGRGALAGPVCAAAVILQNNPALLYRTLNRVRDSKQMTPRERESLAPIIKATALYWGVGFASAEEIDSMGIGSATRLAALRALEALEVYPQYLLLDFRLDLPELDIPQTSIVKGDQRSISIAAASILAKTVRDERMLDLHGQFPDYGFSRHKGYGTSFHRNRILEAGYSPVHRKTFALKSP